MRRDFRGTKPHCGKGQPQRIAQRLEDAGQPGGPGPGQALSDQGYGADRIAAVPVQGTVDQPLSGRAWGPPRLATPGRLL